MRFHIKLRSLLGVLLAAVIAGGFIFYIASRPDESRGTVVIWYVEDDPLSAGLKKLAVEYNNSHARSSLPVKLRCFSDEDALAGAFETGAPDILLCSHYRAFDMDRRGKLTDISGDLGKSGPEYPKTVSSRGSSIGKSFFPVGLDMQALLINHSLCTSGGFDTMDALCAAAGAYRAETGKAFFAVDSYSSLFFTELLREDEEFTAAVPINSADESAVTLYNLLAECAYDGSITVSADSAASAVYSGALPCAIVPVSALSSARTDGFGIYSVPPLRTGSSSGDLGEAFGLAVIAGSSRSTGNIAAFIEWLFSGSRDEKLALQCPLVPAQPGSLIIGNALRDAIAGLESGGIVALPEEDSVFLSNRDGFETYFRSRMAFLSE